MLECDPELEQYAVLYIGGTTFTSAGINVLGRTHRDLPAGVLQGIVERISKVGGQEVHRTGVPARLDLLPLLLQTVLHRGGPVLALITQLW